MRGDNLLEKRWRQHKKEHPQNGGVRSSVVVVGVANFDRLTSSNPGLDATCVKSHAVLTQLHRRREANILIVSDNEASQVHTRVRDAVHLLLLLLVTSRGVPGS